MPKWYIFLTIVLNLPIEAFIDAQFLPNRNLGFSQWYDSFFDQSKRNIKRLAIIRPFSKHDVEVLSHAFEEWNTFLPCNTSKISNGEQFSVDVFLSYSQTFKNSKPARQQVRRIIDDFESNHSGSGWEQCIKSIRTIEAKIDPQWDLYFVNEAHKNRMWVHGPNQQFLRSMEVILGGDFGHYDAVFVMESDVLPVRQYWLDSLLEEAEKDPFMILGSKYDGDSWREFRPSLPLSLQHHINGNAVYNTTHPLLKHLLAQLRLEEDTPYHSIPYDYRISQILVEGMLGILPQLPPTIKNKWSSDTGLTLEKNTKKFSDWWEKYGNRLLIRESQVISNYARTNLLLRHTEHIRASLVHGMKQYTSWDSLNYEITLVISEWHDGLAFNALSQIDAANHPFFRAILMIPHNVAPYDINRLSSIQSNIDVTIQKKKK